MRFGRSPHDSRKRAPDVTFVEQKALAFENLTKRVRGPLEEVTAVSEHRSAGLFPGQQGYDQASRCERALPLA